MTSSSPDIGGSEPDGGSRRYLHTLLMMVVTLTALYLCYRLTAPFVPAIAGALALAVLVAPLHEWLERRLGAGNLASAISVLVAVLLVVLPTVLVASRVLDEASNGAQAVQGLLKSGRWREIFDHYALLAPIGSWLDKQVDLPSVFAPATSWFATGALVLQVSLVQAIGIVLTFYLLFYMLRDRTAALTSLRSLSPLSDADMSRMFAGVLDTVHATVNGTLIVSFVQGALGGLMFWWLGLPSPLLWGIVMGLLAVVPVLGAFIIWVPAAIFLALDGSVGKALVLAVWGTVVVGGIDNLLYPILVGKRTQMHTIVAFVSIVGGLAVFGAAGLILGPVIFTVTRLLLEIWKRPLPGIVLAESVEE